LTRPGHLTYSVRNNLPLIAGALTGSLSSKRRSSMQRVFQTLLILLTIWGLSILTVYILKDWGPMQAFFSHEHGGTVLQASGFLAAVIIVILVLTYVVSKILSKLPLGTAVRTAVTKIHTSISSLFLGS